MLTPLNFDDNFLSTADLVQSQAVFFFLAPVPAKFGIYLVIPYVEVVSIELEPPWDVGLRKTRKQTSFGSKYEAASGVMPGNNPYPELGLPCIYGPRAVEHLR